MADPLHVELVAADRVVWSGEANIVIARTTDGELGVLPNHAPLLSLLVEGTVEIRSDSGEHLVAAVDGGFLSVAHNRVSILSPNAQLAREIDVEQARCDLEQAESVEDAEEAAALARRAQAKIQAVEKAS